MHQGLDEKVRLVAFQARIDGKIFNSRANPSGSQMSEKLQSCQATFRQILAADGSKRPTNDNAWKLLQ